MDAFIPTFLSISNRPFIVSKAVTLVFSQSKLMSDINVLNPKLLKVILIRRFSTMIQIEDLFIKIRDNLDKYQDDITATKAKIGEYREFLDKTVLQINRIRMGRTPAYSKQAQQCSVCNKPYTFIKWCKFCDREQFKMQFSNWDTGHPEFNKVIRDSHLSIKYPKGMYSGSHMKSLLIVNSWAKVLLQKFIRRIGLKDLVSGIMLLAREFNFQTHL